MNNLDPDVAERPEDLVVYGGAGKAARNWACLPSHRRDAAAARGRRDAARAEREAGRRLPHARRSAARAHRQRAPGAALGDLGRVPPPRGARPDDVRPDDGRLVDLHRHAGHPAGHLRDLRRMRPPALRRHARRTARRDRRARRHGRRAAARRDDERRRLPGGRGRSRPHRVIGVRTGYCRRGRPILDDGARSAPSRPGGERGPSGIALVGNIAEVLPATGQARRRSRRRHRSDVGARSARRLHPGGPVARRRPRQLRERDAAGYEERVLDSMVVARRGDARAASTAGAIVFDYGNNLRGQVADHRGLRAAPSRFPASCRRSSGRCSAAAPDRSAGSRCPAIREDIATTDEAMLRAVSRSGTIGHALDREGARAREVPGAARAHLLARVRRARRGGLSDSTGW